MADKKLTRAAGARLGGVCAGAARYFGIDPIIVRIIVVAGSLLTGGLLAVAYVAMIFVLPKSSVSEDVFDVRPESASSDKFGPIDCSAPPVENERQTYVGVGHLPPKPPRSFR